MSLGSIASSPKWKVVVIAPEIEGLLFEDRDVIEALVGHPITDTDFTSGSFNPKTVLKQLLHGKSLAEVYGRKLQHLDLGRIRETSPIRDLQSFIKGTGSRSVSVGRRCT